MKHKLLFHFSKIRELLQSIKIVFIVLLLLLLSSWFIPCFEIFLFGEEKTWTGTIVYIGAISGVFLFLFSKTKDLPWSIKIAFVVLIILLLSWWKVGSFDAYWFCETKIALHGIMRIIFAKEVYGQCS